MATRAKGSRKETNASRRRFLGTLGLAAAAGTTVMAAEPAHASPAATAVRPPLPRVPDDGPPNLLLRMQADVQRAMAKPIAERRWAMAIDLRKCIGCSACTIACVVENKLPPGVVYRPVLEEEVGEYPHVSRKFLPRPCMQCENPPCVPVCPVKATYARADGIVEVNYDACIGCRDCIAACACCRRKAHRRECCAAPPGPRQASET